MPPLYIMTTVSKKKVFFALSVLFIFLILSVVVSFALQPPTLNTSSYLDIGVPSQIDAENLLSLCQIQAYCGSFNSLQPVCLYKGSTSNTLILVLASSSDIGYSCSLSGSSWSVSAITKFRMVLTSQGFSFQSVWQNISIPDSNMVFYSGSYGSSLTVNPNFNFGTQYPSDTLSDIVNSWGEYYQKLVNYESYLESERAAGYAEGESVGYDSGYAEGESEGHHLGFLEGQDVGYDNGYQRGEENGYYLGYDDGYDDGLETGRADQIEFYNSSGFIEATFSIIENGLNKWLYRREVSSGSYEYMFSFPQDISSFDGWRKVTYRFYTTIYISSRPETYAFSLPSFVSDNFPDLQISELVVDRVDENVGISYVNLRLNSSENYDQIYDKGHSEGYQDGLSDANAIVDGISGVTVKPIQALKDAFDFEIFGINVGSVVLGIVAMCFLLFVYKFIRRLLPI